MRVDIVDVIDRRVPLTRKGHEAKACCPFHEEKTPSFTVSSPKQFYHCFGCGANGNAIGFLMDYGNLGFVEAVEELAAIAGVAMEYEEWAESRYGGRPAGGGAAAKSAAQATSLQAVVDEANRWFQQQLRSHAEAAAAIAYLKNRGLDGRIAAEFQLGYAPSGWDNLARALGDSATRRQQLQQAGLVAQRDAAHHPGQPGQPSPPGDHASLYDRFRGRIIFPIEDRRGRVVAFGGRLIGDGEAKYLNSPQTPLFHKGAELYGLNRARRAIGQAACSVVVEGYMDVIALAQFGIDNAVATLGTATTRPHLQRLFQLAPKIVFCFDGDRAGRDAAWKALRTAAAEMSDGRQVGFLFLDDGEDPDSTIRAEKSDGFSRRVAKATPLSDFWLDTLTAEVDMRTLDGKARLLSLAGPILSQLPAGALRDMMQDRLLKISGLPYREFTAHLTAATPAAARTTARSAARIAAHQNTRRRQLSPLALAVSLLLQTPELVAHIEDRQALANLDLPGVDTLLTLIEKAAQDPQTTTARLLESFREQPKIHAYLQQLAIRENHIAAAALTAQFTDTIARLIENQNHQHRLAHIEKLRQAPEGPQSAQIRQEIKNLLDKRTAARRPPPPRD